MEDQRREFAQAAMYCNNFSALCREFGITRRTGLKWAQRYRESQPLTDRSRRPHTSPSRTPEEVELLVLAVRGDNPGWGAKTIRDVLLTEGYTNIPCTKTVNNILNRYGCISQEESLKRQPFTRFEKELCNQMWQADFKGEFRMVDGNYCYPLDIMDDHSRFAIRVAPHLGTANVVIPVFTGAFREFGLPDSILSDNGAQFAGFKKGYTQFERWLMDLDILPIHGRIKHPQTQGKIERFHRSMKQELLNHTTIADIEDAKYKLSAWRDKYNNIRPHEALGMKRPGEVYVPSQRQYRETIEKYEYGGEYHVIKVNSWGYVRFDKWQVYLSETMIDQYIEFRPGPDGETFVACYRNFKIAEFDTEDGQLIHRSIARM
ncbi:MAG: IS481 family transposase [Oscillospiraceae bacterium]|nr:IS481 family transposase [Oscillospiraceae bacterium]